MPEKANPLSLLKETSLLKLFQYLAFIRSKFVLVSFAAVITAAEETKFVENDCAFFVGILVRKPFYFSIV